MKTNKRFVRTFAVESGKVSLNIQPLDMISLIKESIALVKMRNPIAKAPD